MGRPLVFPRIDLATEPVQEYTESAHSNIRDPVDLVQNCNQLVAARRYILADSPKSNQLAGVAEQCRLD